MATYEEDEIEVAEGMESDEEIGSVEGVGLRGVKKVEDRLTVGRRDYGYALVVFTVIVVGFGTLDFMKNIELYFGFFRACH